jgi:Fur family ferric uptake transcriptional regulator
MEKQLINSLRKASLKVTPGRLLILSVLSKSPCRPLDAKSIAKIVKESGLDLATVYRTLATFESKFLIKRVNTKLGGINYELSNHHHDHLVCIDCGILEPFTNCNLNKLTARVLKKSHQFKQINDHSLELLGICKTCATK